WQWAQFKSRFDDDAQTALTADEQLAQIVAGDVFHHFAPGFDDPSIRQRHLYPDKVIPNGPVSKSARSAGVRIKDVSYARLVRARRVDGQPLSPYRQFLLQRFQADAGFHHDGQVLRRVLNHTVERGQCERGELFIVGMVASQAVE